MLNWLSKFWLIALVFSSQISNCWACPIVWPPELLREGEEALLLSPEAAWREEIQLILPQVDVPPDLERMLNKGLSYRSMKEIEIEDLRYTLLQEISGATEVESIITLYGLLREQINRCTVASQTRLGYLDEVKGASREMLESLKVPDGLPAQFDLYIRGAIAFHLGNLPDARDHWEKLLELPRQNRMFKTDCTTYMLAQTWVDEDPMLAINYFQSVVDWCLNLGEKDSFGLRSYDWLAHYKMMNNFFIDAIHHYLRLKNVHVLREAAERCFLYADKQEQLQAIDDPIVQQVIIVYMISNFPVLDSVDNFDENSYFQKATEWFQLLEESSAKAIRGADKIALAAYQAGDMQTAYQWLKLADADSPLANWISAKLALRRGDIKQAREMLEQVAAQERTGSLYKHWWDDETKHTAYNADRVRGELGVLRLDDGDFVGSLDAFMKAGYWVDAAYVAERVLRIEELKDYVDKHYPVGSDKMGSNLRYLLARRMVRADQHLGMVNYFPEDIKPVYQQYLKHLLSARTERTTKIDKAATLMDTARILRWKGMKIASTELEPDWRYYDEGRYHFEGIANIRYDRKVGYLSVREVNYIGNQSYSWYSLGTRSEETFGEPRFSFLLDDEMRRVLKHGPVPERPFTYRYKAVDLAWEAACLLPDDTTQTAMILWEAGRWLAYRDPQSADILYKALVRRNPNIPLARQADQLRWFPAADESAKPIIKTFDRHVSQGSSKIPDESGPFSIRTESPKPFRNWEELNWYCNLEDATKEAHKNAKPVFVYFRNTCSKEGGKFEGMTLGNPQIWKELNDNYVVCLIDSYLEQELCGHYGITSFPTVLALNSDGEVVHRWRGFVGPESFFDWFFLFVENRKVFEQYEQSISAGDLILSASIAERIKQIVPIEYPEIKNLVYDRLVNGGPYLNTCRLLIDNANDIYGDCELIMKTLAMANLVLKDYDQAIACYSDLYYRSQNKGYRVDHDIQLALILAKLLRNQPGDRSEAIGIVWKHLDIKR